MSWNRLQRAGGRNIKLDKEETIDMRAPFHYFVHKVLTSAPGVNPNALLGYFLGVWNKNNPQ